MLSKIILKVDLISDNLLDNCAVMFNQNEKYLLKFISHNGCKISGNEDFIRLIYKLGIKINFENSNPVKQVLDELEFDSHFREIIGS